MNNNEYVTIGASLLDLDALLFAGWLMGLRRAALPTDNQLTVNARALLAVCCCSGSGVNYEFRWNSFLGYSIVNKKIE